MRARGGGAEKTGREPVEPGPTREAAVGSLGARGLSAMGQAALRVARDGGYGWTRTTDPSIMSAVL